MKWYLKVWKQYADFKGRARRKEFWMFVLFNMIAVSAISIFDYILFGSFVVYYIYVLAAFIPSLAVGVRRLHDTGKSGWWMLINLIPLVGLIMYLLYMCEEGYIGNNQYGENPKGQDNTSNNNIDNNNNSNQDEYNYIKI